jgi:hypothetical protein
MLIARRADTRARADFATWKMIAKLNGASSLTAEAQKFLAGYRSLLGKMSEADATEATIQSMYQTYYAEMGGVGTPPAVRPAPAEPKLPVALIFACLVVVYVGIRYLWR